jgi:hypothetical protein
MNKTLTTTVLMAIVIVGLVFVGTWHFGAAQTSTNVSGIIRSDDTWTKVKSPYTLSGPFVIGYGVVLTVEPGVMVNLNGYYIEVSGALNARGTNTEKIQFNGPNSLAHSAITFNPSSQGWSGETGKDCIVENAVFGPIFIDQSSPVIRNNTIEGNINIDKESDPNVGSPPNCRQLNNRSNHSIFRLSDDSE